MRVQAKLINLIKLKLKELRFILWSCPLFNREQTDIHEVFNDII